MACGPEDAAVAAFSAPQGEAAEVVPAIGVLQVQLAALHSGLDEGRRRGAPDYDHTIGVLAKAVQEVGVRVDAVAVGMKESVAWLAKDFAQTRLAVRDATVTARGRGRAG